MKFWHWPQLLIVSAGPISVIAGIAPAQAAALPNAPPAAAATDDARQNITRLVWSPSSANPSRAVVEVIGADSAAVQTLSRGEMTLDLWTSLLAVRVVPPGELLTAERAPLWGSYSVAGAVLRFEPRFPLEPGMRYRAEFDPVRLHAIARTLTSPGGNAIAEPRDTTRLVSEYSAPKKPAHPSSRVVEIYPTSDLLPENLLRFYITFTAPMSRGEAYRRVKLIETATGKRIDFPFLELDEELWSPDGMRFTLLLDPGRVKRGLRPREELGPVLEAGKSYSLVLDGDWPDASGYPLTAGFRKTFQVRQPDESSPDPKTWTIQSPRANTRDPLEVCFPEPLDRALLNRLIRVKDTAAKVVHGQVSVSEAETRWRFTPTNLWREGPYRLMIDTELEDVAGNSVARPFEVDIAGPISARVATKTVELSFRIGPSPR